MIPLKDNIRGKRAPLMTWALIAGNLAAFAYELSLGPDLDPFLRTWAFVPDRVFGGVPALSALVSVATSMFLHGGWLHLLGNMLYLYIFGDNVEDALGRPGFVGFYLAGGAAAALAQGLAEPASSVPMIGASGAVAAVLGAYFVLYPQARILALVPLFIFFQSVQVPAFVFLLFWFLLQFASGALSLGGAAGAAAGVAWWAHVGGFATGLAVALPLRIVRSARSPRR